MSFTNFFIAVFLILLIGCTNKRRIKELLTSDDKADLILGAYKAGETGDKEFVPLLLKNAVDIRTSTNIRFKGFIVYYEKMGALRKIFQVDPPVPITYEPDSVVIKFYTELYYNSR